MPVPAVLYKLANKTEPIPLTRLFPQIESALRPKSPNTPFVAGSTAEAQAKIHRQMYEILIGITAQDTNAEVQQKLIAVLTAFLYMNLSENG